MKKIFISICVLIMMFGLFSSSGQAATLIDDFNDGNVDGWWIGHSQADPLNPGNWRGENGVLMQDLGGDGLIILLDNFSLSDQVAETRLTLYGPAGYGGIIFWFQDYNNLVNINVYPGTGGIWANEIINGVGYGTFYPYPINYNEYLWYTLKVKADSLSGDILVYINNEYLFTYTAITAIRTGQTGLWSGNTGGSFDDYKVYSYDLPPTIDIKPGDDNNTINLKNMKNISVALLSTANYSTPSLIDRTTLTFGKTGDENSLLRCDKKSKDVNQDGLLDLVCNFNVKATGFQCGDSMGILKGKMSLTGMSFEETQVIIVSSCK